MAAELDKLFSDITDSQDSQRTKLPPVEKWDPPLSGVMDLVIARDGAWYHEGAPITRQALVRLFSTILKREGDHYYLVSPVEKWQIRVEDAPFHMRALEVVKRDGQQALVFESTTGDTVAAGPEHPIRVEVNPHSGEPAPYILVRNGMEGLIGRNVFYELADMAEPGPGKKKAAQGVYSLGEFFALE